MRLQATRFQLDTRGKPNVAPDSRPASSSSRHDRHDLNPVFLPRPRSGVGGLDVRQRICRDSHYYSASSPHSVVPIRRHRDHLWRIFRRLNRGLREFTETLLRAKRVFDARLSTFCFRLEQSKTGRHYFSRTRELIQTWGFRLPHTS